MADTTPPPPPATAIPNNHDLDSLKQERKKWLKAAKKEYQEITAKFNKKIEQYNNILEAKETDLEWYLVEGEYEGEHPTSTSVEFKEITKELREHRKEMITNKTAITSGEVWGLNGNVKEGEKLFKELSKLMLRAYNNEADALIKQINTTNVKQKTDSLDKKREDIHKLGQQLGIKISNEYHRLFKQEMQMVQKWKMVQEREKEEKKAERERLREEEKLAKEIKAKQEKLEKERKMRLETLRRMKETGELDKETEATFEDEIFEIERGIKEVERRKANTRAGYVYIISNPGSFGEEIVKIGMTRRLVPEDRVKELGDASVPFRFSTHAIIYSDDAVKLENDLQNKFGAERVNKVNKRKEFFRVKPTLVKEALKEFDAHLVEFNEEVINEEWEGSK